MEQEDDFPEIGKDQYISIPLTVPAQRPYLQLTAHGLMKLLYVAYTSENPHYTLKIFIEAYQIDISLLQRLVSNVFWHDSIKKHRLLHPMGVIESDVELVKSHGHGMNEDDVRLRFLFYATSLCHLWCSTTTSTPRLDRYCSPVLFKSPNMRIPFVWLCPNEWGLPEVVKSYKPCKFSASLTRRECKGNLMHLYLDFFADLDNALVPRISLDVVMKNGEEGKDDFSVTEVDKLARAPPFMLILTCRGNYYCDTVLIQPKEGSYMSYPVVLHLLKEEEL